MYARRFSNTVRISPAGMTAAIAINAGVVALLLTAGPPDFIVKPITTLTATNIPLDPPPPPEPQPRTEPRFTPTSQPYVSEPLIVLPIPAPNDVIVTDIVPLPPLPDLGGSGTATAPVAEPSPPAPVLVDAAIDSRFARAFQPDYPAAERRAGTEGLVRLRVRIGTDGRVLAVERFAAPSDGLFEATRRQALGRWRFTPATRDGVAVESWKTMTVRFELAG